MSVFKCGTHDLVVPMPFAVEVEVNVAFDAFAHPIAEEPGKLQRTAVSHRRRGGTGVRPCTSG